MHWEQPKSLGLLIACRSNTFHGAYMQFSLTPIFPIGRRFSITPSILICKNGAAVLRMTT